MNPISKAIELAGGPVALTREVNKRIEKPVTYQAVLKWARLGRLPRTEWTGETHYARAIAAAVGGKLKVRDLRQRQPAPEALRDMLIEQRDRAVEAVNKSPGDRLPSLILKNRNDALDELNQSPANIAQTATQNVAQGVANV